ncbi:aminopeptidase [Gracilibacillus sp. Marseille-QA3620]
MRDPRLKVLTKQILEHSVKAGKGDKIMIHGQPNTKPLMLELLEEAYKLGAYPFMELKDDELDRQWAIQSSLEQYETIARWEMQRFQDLDALIYIVGEENDAEMTDIPAEVFRVSGEVMKPVTDYYINKCRWVLLNYPTKSLAQKAGMSTSKFEDFLLDVCTVDYAKMAAAMKPLKELMEKTDRVRIVSPGTDLTFSIKGIPAVMCYGERNIPDGEVYTAPVRDSVNGTITYNTPCPYQGTTFRNVSLTFKDGKIIKAAADQSEKINDIFDTDEGARYIGEFALGLNPMIHHPMGDILFDEKINGSIHFTPGLAYKEADNGNVSSIHWDMVLVQREEYGGGEIYFDDRLIRKNGLFVVPELEGLNPNALLWKGK